MCCRRLQVTCLYSPAAHPVAGGYRWPACFNLLTGKESLSLRAQVHAERGGNELLHFQCPAKSNTLTWIPGWRGICVVWTCSGCAYYGMPDFSYVGINNFLICTGFGITRKYKSFSQWIQNITTWVYGGLSDTRVSLRKRPLTLVPDRGWFCRSLPRTPAGCQAGRSSWWEPRRWESGTSTVSLQTANDVFTSRSPNVHVAPLHFPLRKANLLWSYSSWLMIWSHTTWAWNHLSACRRSSSTPSSHNNCSHLKTNR